MSQSRRIGALAICLVLLFGFRAVRAAVLIGDPAGVRTIVVDDFNDGSFTPYSVVPGGSIAFTESGGTVNGTIAANTGDPNFRIPSGSMSLDAVRYPYYRMRENGDFEGNLQVFYSGPGAGESEPRSFTFGSIGATNGYVERRNSFNLTNLSPASTVTRLRFDPTGSTGATAANFNYDYVIVDRYQTMGLGEFDRGNDLQGWTAGNTIGPTVAGSVLSGTADSSNDPMVYSYAAGIDANQYKFIEIRMRRDTGTGAEMFWGASGFDGGRRVDLSAVGGDGQYHVYWIDMRNEATWTGTINALRLDPATTAGKTFDIDYIRVVNTGPYTWTNPAGGSWATTTNWSGGAAPNAAGLTADFSTWNIAADTTVTLDGATTVGNLVFADLASEGSPATYKTWTISPGTGGDLTLAVAAGAPTITVDSGAATISAVVAGTQGLAKYGNGTLTLAGANSPSTGNVTVQAGLLRWGADDALPSGTITVQSGATVDLYAMTNVASNSRAYSIAGTGTAGQGALVKTTGAGMIGSNAVNGLTLAADATIGGSLRFDLAGFVDLNNFVLTKTGANAIPFRTSNIQDTSGGLVINQGNIYFESFNAAFTGPVVINGGGSLGTYMYNNTTYTFTAPIVVNDGGRLFAGSQGGYPGTGDTILAGTIALSGTTRLATGYNGYYGQSPGDMFVNSTISGSGTLILNDAAETPTNAVDREIRFNAANTYSGDVRIGRGTLRLGNALALQNATFDTQTAAAGTLSFGSLAAATLGGLKGSNPLSLQNDSAEAVALTVGNNNQDTQYSGVVSGSGSFTKVGTGVLTLTNANTYSGETRVQGPVLAISNANALGATTAGTTVTSGSQLRLLGGLTFAPEPVTISGPGYGDGEKRGALRSHSGNNVWTGPITVTGAGETWISGGTLTLTGGITGNGVSLRLDQGSPTITTTPINLGTTGSLLVNSNALLSVAGNTFGTLRIDWSGVLRLGMDNALPANVAVLLGTSGGSNAGTGILNVNGFNQTIGRLLDGGTYYANETVTNSASTAATLTINQSANSTYQGKITGNLALTKQGGGTLTLAGGNTYTGETTISTGILALSTTGTNNIPASSLITVGEGTTLDVTGVSGTGGFALAAAQTLRGAGTVQGTMTIAGGATVSPGLSPGTLNNTGIETWGGGGIYAWEINATEDAGGVCGNDPGWDWLNIDGPLSITATPSNPFVIDVRLLGLGGMPDGFFDSPGHSWEIAAASSVSGFDESKFSVLQSGSQGNLPGMRWYLSQEGNSVYLHYAVPEPSTFVLASLALLGLSGIGRRRRGYAACVEPR
jgi:autotransporter-associated beta strand protein